MRLRIKGVVAGAAALVTVGGMLAVAPSAFALNPGYEPDPNAGGTITFFNAAGQPITSGSTLTPVDYYVASGTGAGSVVTAEMYTPQAGVNPALWSGTSITGGTSNPLASGPANLVAQPGNAIANGSAAAFGSTFDDYVATFPNTSADPLYAGIYQVRIPKNATQYYRANIQIAGTTWTQVDPLPAVAGTTTTVSAAPSSGLIEQGATAVTLTGGVTAAGASAVYGNPAGSIEFFAGAVSLGSVAYPGTGTVDLVVNSPAPALALGANSITGVFTPSSAAFAPSTSPAVNVGPVTGGHGGCWPGLGLAVTPVTGTSPLTVTVTAAVTDTRTAPNRGAPVGTVQFKDGGSNLGAPVAVDAAGVAVGNFTLVGPTATRTITATFLPAASSDCVSSSSLGVDVALTGAAFCDPAYDEDGAAGPIPPRNSCTDPQNFVLEVPAGSLLISTPYTAANPFDLGVLDLNADGTQYAEAAPFGTAANPAAGVTIVDTRAGSNAFTASAQVTSTFTSGPNTIDDVSLGFVNVAPVYIAGNGIRATTGPLGPVLQPAKPVTPVDNPARSLANPSAQGLGAGVPHTVAGGTGAGSVYLIGDMEIKAPTSVQPGIYNATVIFTIA